MELTCTYQGFRVGKFVLHQGLLLQVNRLGNLKIIVLCNEF